MDGICIRCSNVMAVMLHFSLCAHANEDIQHRQHAGEWKETASSTDT